MVLVAQCIGLGVSEIAALQQELMRHLSIQTTMNVYGQAKAPSKREANERIGDGAQAGEGERLKP